MVIRPMMAMAEMAASPKGRAAVFRQMVPTEAMPWRRRLGRPARVMAPYIRTPGRKSRSRMEIAEYFLIWNSRMPKDTAWETMVARAAPAMPMSKTKMNRGSRAMFSTPPVVRPTMARKALPSKRRRLLSTKEAHIQGAPIRINRR